MVRALASTLVGAALTAAPPLGAQVWVRLAGQGIVVGQRQDPISGGGSLTEVRLVQPVATLEAGAGRFALTITADFEGLTIPNGELTIGAWGEGFVDRRHPHTYLHELVLAARVLGRSGGPAG